MIQQIKEAGILEVTSAELVDTSDDRESVLFTYTTESQQENYGFLLFYKNAYGEYVECQDTEIQQKITEEHLCNICNGTGSVLSADAVACAICGGTGQQYMPNL